MKIISLFGTALELKSVILEFWFSFPCFNVTVWFCWDSVALSLQNCCFIEVIRPLRITGFVVLNKQFSDQSSIYECSHTIFLPQNTQDSLPTKYFLLDAYSPFILRLVFSCYSGSASLWRCISHYSSSQSFSVASQPPEFSIISALLGLSLELPFFLSLSL